MMLNMIDTKEYMARRFRRLRNDSRLTQETAAELLGISRHTLSNYERCYSDIPIITALKMDGLYKKKDEKTYAEL